MREQEATILVADDERAIREGCQRVLGARGYRVLLAENGQEALEILSREPVQVLLLDLKMPVMGGEEVLQVVRERSPHIPVIIITGHGTVDTAVECMKRGAYDFITKPFQVDPFLITVRRAVERVRLDQETRRLQEESARNLYGLHMEQSRLRTIIECMGHGVMVTNGHLELVLHNPAFMRLMEIPGEVRNPLPVAEILPCPSLLDTLRKILGSDPASRDAVIVQEIAAGKRTLRATSAPLLGPEGTPVGTVAVLEDVTPLKQLDQMKTDFINLVVHELRSPLVSIQQLNHVVLQGLAGPLGEKQEDFIRRGSRKIETLLSLINDLLEVARIESGQLVQRRVPTDIGRLLQELMPLMEPRAREQNITLTCSVRDLKPVRADPKSIEEILTNLITNAINYSPGGGRVTVTAMGKGEYLEIRVEDTGVGIPQEELPRIFERFYRVKHPRTRQVMGTGLGLAIVKGAVEAHQGTIDVESVPDQGTTFRILLPAIRGVEER
jgi:signal transduction histidine kinase/FixJ family two-component response regulator